MTDTTKPGDPVAALLQRLRKGRKTDQRGAFGGRSRANRAPKTQPMTPTTKEQ